MTGVLNDLYSLLAKWLVNILFFQTLNIIFLGYTGPLHILLTFDWWLMQIMSPEYNCGVWLQETKHSSHPLVILSDA